MGSGNQRAGHPKGLLSPAATITTVMLVILNAISASTWPKTPLSPYVAISSAGLAFTNGSTFTPTLRNALFAKPS